MPSTTPGGLSRRSFLAAATAVGVMAVGATVVGAFPAAAAPGWDATWRITSEPADARTGYAALINAIKNAVASHQVRPDGGRPLHVTDEDGTNEFINIDLYNEDGPEFIRIYMRRSDAYVMGWRPGTDNGGSDITWRQFFPLDPDVDLPGAIRTGDNANVNTRFQNLANYSDLQRQGANRDGMQITPGSLNNAVLTMYAAADNSVLLVAPAILQIIVALAEGSRFRNQAAATATAFGNGTPYTLTAEHIEQHNNWGTMSSVLLGAILVGQAVLSPEIEIGEAVYVTAAALASILMLAHHSNKHTKGKGLLEESTTLVSPDGTGDFWTVQAAIDDAPTSGSSTIFVDEGVYHEVITVPSNKSWLTIQGVSGDASDIVIYNTRAHGMLKPDGTPWGTEGSAVATFKAPNLLVRDLTISNTFDPADHPEVSAYETQAVAVAARGDRQVYANVRLLARQDTLLVKSPVPTDQTRMYFYDCYIKGCIDFVFGNATAVIDRSTIRMTYWPGGTVLAPNTDESKKYGILITDSAIEGDSDAPLRSMYLGRPWHNTTTASPQAVVRDTVVYPPVNDTHPWTDMTTDYSWTQARFHEYNNSGLGAGVQNAPKLTDAEAADYTAQKYLAGTDGWNPVM
ncbi:pectinesterase family protein [Streptomyces sp. NPDC046909]|uniref:pectinesterase family protein n=1 Tax=Streptomyces sp. NPDC046909 TaxID=3155617 RepID=UPI0033F83BD2